MSDRPTYRQYIGARYVPKFFENSSTGNSEWASGVTYEPLTIVTWNQNVYTSKKQVPSTVGQPNLNPSYWALMGNFNSAISDLNDRVDDIEDDISDINDEISLLENRHVVLISDSYAQSENSFARILKEGMGLGSTNFHKYAMGGAGFVGATQGKSFVGLLNDAIADTSFDHNTVTDVVVAGGCNDASSSYTMSAILNARDSFIATAKTAFPNAMIHVAMIGGFVSSAQQGVIHGATLTAYNYYTDADRVNIINNAFLPMCAIANFNSDGVHPNETGANAEIGYLLASAVRSRSCFGSYRRRYAPAVSAKTGYTLGSVPSFTAACNGSHWLLLLKNTLNMTGTFQVNYSTGGVFDILSSSNFIVPNAASANDALPLYSIPVQVLFYVNSTEAHFETGCLNVYGSGNNVSIALFLDTASASYSAGLIRIKPFCVNVCE